MTSSRAKSSTALLLALAMLGSGWAPAAAQTQDQPQAQGQAVRVPPGQGDSGPSAVQPQPQAPAQSAQNAPDRAAPDKDGGDLDRARAAARAADPRLEGLEKAREAARKSQDQGGAKDCMSAREARNAILAKKAVTLSQALRAARAAWEGEVIDYKLCVFDGVLAYDLTLLNGDGRVGRVRVGAVDGKLVNVR